MFSTYENKKIIEKKWTGLNFFKKRDQAFLLIDRQYLIFIGQYSLENCDIVMNSVGFSILEKSKDKV